MRPQSTHTRPIAPKAQALSYLAPPFSLIVPLSLQPLPLLPWPFFLIYLLSFLQQFLPFHKRRRLFFQELTLSSKITPLDQPLPPLAPLAQGSALSTAPPTAPPVPCRCSPGAAHSVSSPGPRYVSLLPPGFRGQLPHELGRASSLCSPWSAVGPHAKGGEAATAAHTLTSHVRWQAPAQFSPRRRARATVALSYDALGAGGGRARRCLQRKWRKIARAIKQRGRRRRLTVVGACSPYAVCCRTPSTAREGHPVPLRAPEAALRGTV